MANQASKRVCPLLERESATKILSDAPSPWILRQCLETGFVFLENPPGYEALKEDYAFEVTFKQESERRKKAEPIFYAVSTGLKRLRGRMLDRNKIRDLCGTFLKNEQSARINLLDLGCGWGGHLQTVIASLPAEVGQRCVPHGIELSKELARISDEKFREGGGGWCVHDNALNGIAAFPADYFNLIIMSSFLEHEINPLPLLRACREHLRPDGHVIVKVPNYGCLNRRIRGPKWCGFRWPDHVNYFTPDTLKAMVARAGLKVSRMTFSDRQPFSDSMYAVLTK